MTDALTAAAAELRAAAADLRSAHLRAQIAPHALVPYGEFIAALGLSYDLAARLRREGTLRAVSVGSKLFCRAGHAEEVARALPVARPAEPTPKCTAPKRRRTATTR